MRPQSKKRGRESKWESFYTNKTFFYYCHLKWYQHHPWRHRRQDQYISAVFFHVCVRANYRIHLWVEADTGGFVSQPTSCCISSSLVNCKCVGIFKQRNQKYLTILMHRKGAENGRNPNVVSYLGDWPHSYFDFYSSCSLSLGSQAHSCKLCSFCLHILSSCHVAWG